jgi:hypothetical protein
LFQAPNFHDLSEIMVMQHSTSLCPAANWQIQLHQLKKAISTINHHFKYSIIPKSNFMGFQLYIVKRSFISAQISTKALEEII